MDGIEEITASILGPRTSMSQATEQEIRSLGAILALHRYLLARGWEFESAHDLVIWIWPPSRIEDNGDVVPSTDVWVSIDQAVDGPERIDVAMSLVGEPDTDEDEWAVRFPIMEQFDAFPLDSAEAYRLGDPLPRPWSRLE